MTLDPRLKFVICPGRFPEKKHTEVYNKIYQCWYEVWSQTFLEIDNNSSLFSDAFTRQDIISCLFYDDECIALSVYRYIDFTNPSSVKDSYFANWNEMHIKHLCKNGPQVLVGSYVTIHPKARKSALGLKMKDYLVGLAAQVFLTSNCDSMTGAMRKNRKIHETVYEWGASLIAKDIPSGHNDLVDLVGFFKPEMIENFNTHPVSSGVQHLWEQRLIINQELPNENEVFTKKISITEKKAA